ncbi:MAG: trypsin-like peptidase domain-containing protein [Armatimonadetes bacterium]|nr:trypsin-like peptidase domain-containing protein [Armatimonadota bacterium]
MSKQRQAAVAAIVMSLLLAGCRQSGTAQRTAPATVAPAADTAKAMVPHAASSGALAAMEGTLQNVYATLNKSVVNIQVLQKARPMDQNVPGLGQFGPFNGPMGPGGQPRGFARQGSGSGFVWDTKGHIITNNHVVAEADKIRVTFNDGTMVSAKVVGSDPDSDLAVVKVELGADRLAPVTLADSTQVKVGQMAIAIGNPFGLEGTMTVGFVSALGRLLPTQSNGDQPNYNIPDVLQTDAPINPGNSGGVLADSGGNIIGVTSAIISPAGASAGIGFAIPSAVVAKVVPTLITKGRYEHPYLGIVGLTLNPDLAKAMGLKTDQRGGLVSEVVPGSPADKAGVRGSDRKADLDGDQISVGGDVITALDDKAIRSFDDVVTELARTGEVGKTITLTVLRGGKTEKLPIQLSARPNHGSDDTAAKPTAAEGGNGVKLGIVAGTLTPEVAKAMGLKETQKGVLVQAVDSGSAADKASLRGSFKPLPGDRDTKVGGDIIVALDGKAIDDLPGLQTLLTQVKPGGTATLSVLRDGKKVDVKVTFGQ